LELGGGEKESSAAARGGGGHGGRRRRAWARKELGSGLCARWGRGEIELGFVGWLSGDEIVQRGDAWWCRRRDGEATALRWGRRR